MNHAQRHRHAGPGTPAAVRHRAVRYLAVRLLVLVASASLLLGACGPGATLAPAPSGSAEPSASPAATLEPTPTPEPTPKPVTRVPSRPTKVTFKKGAETIDDATTGAGSVKARITWQSSDDTVTEFKVWGVLRCVNESKKTDGKPCLVAGQPLKKADLELVATFPGAARSGTIEVTILGEVTTNALFGSSDFYALVLGAYNEKGESVLAIVTASKVCWQCTY